MGASRPLLAVCLTGILATPVAGLCTSPLAQTRILSSDAPAHPGLKSSDAASQRVYGDEPGDSSAHARHGEGMPAESAPASSIQPSPNTHGAVRAHISAHSAVLDTLGVAHDGTDMGGGSDAQGLGLTLRPLTAAERQTLGLDSGLLVTGVTAGMALKAGFQTGDVVLSLDGVGLTSTDQFLKLTQKLPHDRPVPVLVHRPNSNLFLPLGAPSRR